MSIITQPPYIAQSSEASPENFNRNFRALYDNVVSLNTIVIQGQNFSGMSITVPSNTSNYIYLQDSLGQKSSYIIGSQIGGTADGLNIWDASGNTLLASFSKQSIRFFQNVVGPVFDVGGALANTLNAATFGTALDSNESRIQAAISSASQSKISRVYLPSSMYPYSAASVIFDDSVQMVREGGEYGSYDARAYGASGISGRDDTRAIQEALDAAENFQNNIASVVVPDGVYDIAGTLSVGTGVTLFGATLSSEYEDGFAGGALAFGSTLWKRPSGNTGAVVSLNWTASIHHLNLKHTKPSAATAGILRIGSEGSDVNCTNCAVSDIQILGQRSGFTSGNSTCYGIRFPDSKTGKARYFNKFHGVRVQECDVGIKLGGQSNGNVFTNISSRENHVHYELNGGDSLCIENAFTGLGLFSIQALSPAPIGFLLKNAASHNIFTGYQTEMFGRAYSIDSTTCTANVFMGLTNEPTPSTVPQPNVDIVDRPWTTPAYSAGDFTANGSMTWTVDAGDLTTYQYMTIGHVMKFQLVLVGTAIGGSINDHIMVKIPGGLLIGKLSAGYVHLNIGGTPSHGYYQALPGQSVVEIYRFDFSNHVVAALNVIACLELDVSG